MTSEIALLTTILHYLSVGFNNNFLKIHTSMHDKYINNMTLTSSRSDIKYDTFHSHVQWYIFLQNVECILSINIKYGEDTC